jgi:hypothetical protein
LIVSEPVTEAQIRVTCQAMIAARDRRAYHAALADFEGLHVRPGLQVAGPVMVATFSESIEVGCAALGAMKNGLPDVTRFEPNEGAIEFLPGSKPARVEARCVHRAMARRVREFVGARAAGDGDRVDALYHQLAKTVQVSNFVFMLWATAMVVRRYVDAGIVIGRACPVCGSGVLEHFARGEPLIYTCGHLDQPPRAVADRGATIH